MAKSKYKSKKKTDDGGTVYEYSDRQVKQRNRDKSKKVEKLSGNIDKLRKRTKKDLGSDDEKIRIMALATALMDETYARVGNKESEDERGHFGVTGWRKEHFTFHSNGEATVKYTGKSGVDQEKKIKDKKVVKALKELAEDKDAKDPMLTYCSDEKTCRLSSSDVNSYLNEFEITAKDLRGYHANEEMRKALKKQRKDGKKLPDDKKKREEILKKEFQAALDEVSDMLGHEDTTLKNQYLVVGLEDHYMEKGKPMSKFDKKAREMAAAMIDQLKTAAEGKATLVEFYGDASVKERALFRVQPGLKSPHTGETYDYVITSFNGSETLAFPADKNGRELHGIEIAGGPGVYGYVDLFHRKNYTVEDSARHRRSSIASRVAQRAMNSVSELNELSFMMGKLLEKVDRIQLSDSRLKSELRKAADDLDEIISVAQETSATKTAQRVPTGLPHEILMEVKVTPNMDALDGKDPWRVAEGEYGTVMGGGSDMFIMVPTEYVFQVKRDPRFEVERIRGKANEMKRGKGRWAEEPMSLYEEDIVRHKRKNTLGVVEKILDDTYGNRKIQVHWEDGTRTKVKTQNKILKYEGGA